MDHRSGSGHQSAATAASEGHEDYITDNGNRFRIPYRMIKKATFTDLSRPELVDLPHAARLQYRLLLLDPIIKATVDFTKAKITVIYNPDTAANSKEKISLEELGEILKKEGITTSPAHTANEDYDYYKEFYSYAFNAPPIRETAPYGYTQEQWRKLKPAWEKKVQKGEATKQAKFREFQEEYLEENPEMAQRIDPNFRPGTRSGGKDGSESKGI